MYEYAVMSKIAGRWMPVARYGSSEEEARKAIEAMRLADNDFLWRLGRLPLDWEIIE